MPVVEAYATARRPAVLLKVKPALPPKLLPSLNCTCVFDPPGVPLPEPALSSSQTTLPDESVVRSEEHTSELQSQFHLVCRLLLETMRLQAKAVRALRGLLTLLAATSFSPCT